MKSSMEAFANNFATMAHMGQVRKCGEEYINHPRRVMETTFVNDDDVLTDHEISMARLVALLHDVVEDTDTTLEQIALQFPLQDVVDAVDLLTREKHLTYANYIARLIASKNKIAIAVKLGDLTDNINSSHCLEEDSMREIREKRWLPTYDKLVKVWLDFPERSN